MITIITGIILLLFFLASAIRILNEYERGVIFRLGRVIGAKGPGLVILIPIDLFKPFLSLVEKKTS